MDRGYRLFIAIELPSEVRSALDTARDRLEAHGSLAVRWVDPGAAHLTLKFLGATPPERVKAIAQALGAAADLHRAFVLRTTDLGVFPRPSAPRVVWLGVGGDIAHLRMLQADVERLIAPLGFPTEVRAFSPHLTLGRAGKRAGVEEQQAISHAVAVAATPPSAIWDVKHLALMRSELLKSGARYSALERVSLDRSEAAAIIPGADEPDAPQHT